MKGSTLIATAACLCFLAAVAAPAQQVPEDWRLERQEWTWEVDATAEIRLTNPWGDLAVRAHKLPEIYLLANWQHHRDDPRTLHLAAEHTSDKVTLQIGFVELELAEVPTDWAPRRTDVTIFVPEHAVTHFSTDKGKLEVRGTRAPTTVKTGGGDIKLRIFGSVTAATDHGAVLAQFRRSDWAPPVDISTATGAVRVEMPRGSDPRATLETRGEITSDYSMQVERVEGSQLKRARLRAGEAGSSGGTLEVRSYSGPIAVVETLVSDEKDGGSK